MECAYPDAAAAAARCPKLMGCLKKPAAAAVAAVTLLWPAAVTAAAAAASADDDLDGASMLSMVNNDEPPPPPPTVDVFGTTAELAAAMARPSVSQSPPHGCRGDSDGGDGEDDDGDDIVVFVVRPAARSFAGPAVGGRSPCRPSIFIVVSFGPIAPGPLS